MTSAVASPIATTQVRAVDAALSLVMTFPPEVWREVVGELDADEQGTLVRTLDELIEQATRLRGYVDARNPLLVTSVNDPNYEHAKGVRQSNALTARVMRELGRTSTHVAF